MNTFFSLKVPIEVTFPWKNAIVHDNCFELIFAPVRLPLSLFSHMDLPSIWWKKLFTSDLSFSKLKCPHLLGAEDNLSKVDEKRKLKKSANKSHNGQFYGANNFLFQCPRLEWRRKILTLLSYCPLKYHFIIMETC